MEWVQDRPLSELTITELCRRAAVHRVTFYSHWPDIDALASEAFGELVDALARISDEQITDASTAAELGQVYRGALRGQLAELLEHRTVYRELFSGGRFGLQVEEALRLRAELAVDNLVNLGVEVPGYAAVAVAGMARACFAAWVNSEAVDVESAATDIERQLPPWMP